MRGALHVANEFVNQSIVNEFDSHWVSYTSRFVPNLAKLSQWEGHFMWLTSSSIKALLMSSNLILYFVNDKDILLRIIVCELVSQTIISKFDSFCVPFTSGLMPYPSQA